MRKIFIVFVLLMGLGWASFAQDQYTKVSTLEVEGVASSQVSASGFGRIYFDTDTNTFQVSQNGGAYGNLLGTLDDAYNNFGGGTETVTVDSGALNFNLSAGTDSFMIQTATTDWFGILGTGVIRLGGNNSYIRFEDSLGNPLVIIDNDGAQDSVAFGKSALGAYAGAGADNTAIGMFALSTLTTGARNTAIGNKSLSGNTYALITDNTAVGESSCNGLDGDFNVCIGSDTGFNTTSSTATDYNVWIGGNAGNSGILDQGQVLIGYDAEPVATSGDDQAIGIGYGVRAGNNAVSIGYNCTANDNTVNICAGGSANSVLSIDATAEMSVASIATGSIGLEDNTAQIILDSNDTTTFLYAGQGSGTGDGDVLTDNGGWGVSYNGSQENIYALVLYNGKLYAAQGTDLGDGDVLVFDGVAWATSYDGSERWIFDLEVYNDKLYAAQGGDHAGDGDVYVFDGSTWSLSYAGTQEYIFSLETYNGKLYAGQGINTGDGDVYVFDGSTWSLSYDGSQEVIYDLESHGGNLYAGQGYDAGGDGDIYVFNGSSWVIDYDGAQEAIFSLASHDGVLYAGQGSGAGDGDVLDNDGGWAIHYDGSQEVIYALHSASDGNLYAGGGNGAGDGDIFVWNGAVWSTEYDGAEEHISSIGEFGGARTTLQDSASSNVTITFPDATGIVHLSGQDVYVTDATPTVELDAGGADASVGIIRFGDSDGDGTLQSANLTGARTWTLPDRSATLAPDLDGAYDNFGGGTETVTVDSGDLTFSLAGASDNFVVYDNDSATVFFEIFGNGNNPILVPTINWSGVRWLNLNANANPGTVGLGFGTFTGGCSTNCLENVGVGYQSAYNSATGDYNTFVGFKSGYDIDLGGTDASHNTGIGNDALENITGNDFNTAVGSQAGNLLASGDSGTNGDYNTLIGYNADVQTATTYRATAIGAANGASTDAVSIGYGCYALNINEVKVCAGGAGNQMVLMDLDEVAIGDDAATDPNGVSIGYRAGAAVAGSATGNVFVGDQSGDTTTSGINNALFGYGTDVAAANDNYGVAFGSAATTGSDAIAIGRGCAAADNEVKFCAGGDADQVFYIDTNEYIYANNFVISGTEAGVTVGTGGQGTGVLTMEVNEVATANANDDVTLPSAQAGMHCIIINNSGVTIDVFPSSGDNLGAGVDTSTTQADGVNIHYVAYDATNWEVI